MHCAAGFFSLCPCPFVSGGECGWLSTCPEHWGPPHTHGAHLGSLSQHPCLVTGREGRVACFLLPRTYQLLRSWSEAKGNNCVCLRLIAGGRAEVVFLLLICCHCACGDVNGGLFSRGIHCAICACSVSNVFRTTKYGVAQDRNTWMCESIVLLARNNTCARSFSESVTSRSSERSKLLVGHHFICGVGTARENGEICRECNASP
ncbi:N-acetyltransferase complex ARD1 subunit [Trypanosoma cruzi cruzi]|nr:N-acetyltransferase complex ARD1 subunit [Trypanosoma cruzi cruzi]